MIGMANALIKRFAYMSAPLAYQSLLTTNPTLPRLRELMEALKESMTRSLIQNGGDVFDIGIFINPRIPSLKTYNDNVG